MRSCAAAPAAAAVDSAWPFKAHADQRCVFSFVRALDAVRRTYASALWQQASSPVNVRRTLIVGACGWWILRTRFSSRLRALFRIRACLKLLAAAINGSWRENTDQPDEDDGSEFCASPIGEEHMRLGAYSSIDWFEQARGRHLGLADFASWLIGLEQTCLVAPPSIQQKLVSCARPPRPCHVSVVKLGMSVTLVAAKPAAPFSDDPPPSRTGLAALLPGRLARLLPPPRPREAARDEDGTDHTLALPDETLLEIFSFVAAAPRVYRLAGVCRRWRAIVRAPGSEGRLCRSVWTCPLVLEVLFGRRTRSDLILPLLTSNLRACTVPDIDDSGRLLEALAETCPQLEFASVQAPADGPLTRFFRGCPRLECLRLRVFPEVTAAPLFALARRPTALRSLALFGRSRDWAWEEALAEVVRASPLLENFEVIQSPASDRLVGAIARHCPRLARLDLRAPEHAPLSGEALRPLAALAAERALVHLRLDLNFPVSAEQSAPLLACPNLQTLALAWRGPRAALELPAGRPGDPPLLPGLVSLTLAEAGPRLTDADLEALTAACAPRLQRLVLRDARQLTAPPSSASSPAPPPSATSASRSACSRRVAAARQAGVRVHLEHITAALGEALLLLAPAPAP
eukprot:tig00020537_g10252.t1